MTRTFQWICTDQELASASALWMDLPYVAMDTEFMRVDTFYPIAGLMQLSDGSRTWLIDPLRIQNWTPLAQLLAAPHILKVLHACNEDLEVFGRVTGTLPHSVFDTQLAAAYLNMGFSVGYSRLVEQILGLELPKAETRSDWLQRPLSATQIRYAVEDVQHLAEVFEVLFGRLSPEKRAWLLEDTDELVTQLSHSEHLDLAYQEVKQAWRFKPAQLAVLKLLAAWREEQARLRDLPRNRILRDNTLWQLAQTQPKDLVSLAKIDDIHPKTLRQDGACLLALIKRAKASAPDQWPEVLEQPLPLNAAALLKKLRTVVQAEAVRLDIAPELALRRKTLEALVRTGYPKGPYRLPESLRGWRRAQLGPVLLRALEVE